MQKLLTIVVPVYKVEQYINKCLDSCIVYKADGLLDEEKMTQLEVIIVNDGTPDNAAELSREYTKRYPQTFRQIDKENGGHGSAWNVGLKKATGKYLRFLDSDDWLTNLDKLMEKLVDCEADLVFTNMQNVYENGRKNRSYFSESENCVLPITSFSPYNFDKHWDAGNFHFCTYRTVILQREYPLFLEGVSYDDSILFEASFLSAQSYMFVDIVLYNYLLGRQGQSVDFLLQQKRIHHRIANINHQVRFVKNHPAKSIEIQGLVRDLLWGEWMQAFEIITTLPFYKCRCRLKELNAIEFISKNIPPSYSKKYKRYKSYPYIVFRFIELLRKIKA